MRILFLEYHLMWIHGLPNGFRDLGHDVKISGKLTEKKLARLLELFRPELIISLGWTRMHKPWKRKWLYQHISNSGIPHIFWATEDPTHHETFSLPYVRSVKPDFVFTICRSTVKKYKKMGIPSAHLDFGHHRSVHRSGTIRTHLQINIAVVANGYSKILKQYPHHFRIKSLQHLIRPLVHDDTRIDFWGRQWSQMRPILGKKIPRPWLHGYLPYPEAHQVYNSAKIVLAPQNHLTQVTQRTYEILGSGGFLLTNDTPEIRRLFKPNKELIVSNSPAQTRRLVHYFLDHPEQREKIRKQGMLAVQKHSYKHRAAQILTELKKHKLI